MRLGALQSARWPSQLDLQPWVWLKLLPLLIRGKGSVCSVLKFPAVFLLVFLQSQHNSFWTAMPKMFPKGFVPWQFLCAASAQRGSRAQPCLIHHFYSKGLPVYHDSSTANINSKTVLLQVKKLSYLLAFSVFTAHSVHAFTFSCTGILLTTNLIRFTKKNWKTWNTWFEYKPSNTPHLLHPTKAPLKKRTL